MIEAVQLTKRYGDTVAVDGVSFPYNPGGSPASSARTGPVSRPPCG